MVKKSKKLLTCDENDDRIQFGMWFYIKNHIYMGERRVHQTRSIY